MKALNSKEIQSVSGGVIPFIPLADFAVGITIGATARKLIRKYYN